MRKGHNQLKVYVAFYNLNLLAYGRGAVVFGPVDRLHFTYNTEVALHTGDNDPVHLGTDEHGCWEHEGISYSDMAVYPRPITQEDFKDYNITFVSI